MSSIEVFPDGIRFERNAQAGIILQRPAVFDDLMPEQRRRLIQDHEIEIICFQNPCQRLHELQTVSPRLDSSIKVDRYVRIAEGTGLAARPLPEQVGELHPSIFFEEIDYGGQVLHFSIFPIGYPH